MKKTLKKVITTTLVMLLFVTSINIVNVKASRQDFLNRIATAAVEMGKETGRFPSVAIAQAILESGWGTSRLARTQNNILGIKNRSGGWRSFDSFEHAMRHYGTLFTSTNGLKRHYARFLNAKTPNEAAYALNMTYAMSNTYGDKLIALMRKYNLYQYDAMAFGTSVGDTKEKAVSNTSNVSQARKEAAEKARLEKERQEKLAKLKEEAIRLEKLKLPSLKLEEAYKRLIEEYAQKHHLLIKQDLQSLEFNGINFHLKETEKSVLEKGNE